MKKISILLLAIITAGSLKSQVLNVSEVIQEEDQWCWAAVSACILDYYCAPTPQCEIAEYTRNVATWNDFGDTDCCVDPTLGCNYPNYCWGFDGSILDILGHFGNISTYGFYSSLTKTEITTEIQNNRLFVVQWVWDDGGAHFIVGHGLIGNNMYYMDPWFGEGLKVADYDWVESWSDGSWAYTGRISEIPTNGVPANAGTISGANTVCQGQNSVTYTVPPIENATSYVWNLPTGATGTSTTNNIDVNFGLNAISGDIEVKGVNSCGDGISSTLSVNVNTKPDTPNITLNEFVLHSDAPNGNQWYNENGLISGATEQNYTATVDGDYHVIVTLSGCSSDPSNIINVSGTIIDVVELDRIVKTYPNPVSNELTIETGIEDLVNFDILNAVGQIILKGDLINKTSINTDHLAAGVYFIKLKIGETYKFKKIIKQ